MIQKALEDFSKIYFIGVGGIGMSAIARWFAANGKEVAGYDKTATPLTEELGKEGIDIHYKDDIDLIPSGFLDDPKDLLIVYTPAIPKDHQELVFFQEEEDWNLIKRSQALGIITQNSFTVAVAGTHGKTTTSSMIAHLLNESGVNTAAFLGGISANLNSNLLLNKRPNPTVVVEADEYDRSFLTLSPNISIVTTMEPDHLDIYGDTNGIEKSFGDFMNKIPSGGTLIVHQDIYHPVINDIIDRAEVKRYGDAGAYKAENIQVKEACFQFDFIHPAGRINELQLFMPGYHNVQNAVAALSVGLELGVDTETLKESLATFKGVKRRFEYHLQRSDFTYIDDYAHHPSEIEAFLKSVRALFPNKKITAVFQPHLFTRTRDFLDGFAKSLALADEIILMDIYPAREKPIKGVTSELLLNKIEIDNKMLVPDDKVLEIIQKVAPEVLVTIGAGDIDRFIDPIVNSFK